MGQDEHEAQSPLIAPTRLRERWRYRQTGFSPFGVCVRPAGSGNTLPFETWAYRPPYLPPGMQIDVATGTSEVEPLLFAAPISRRPDAVAAGRRQPLDHPVGFAEVTGLRITLPGATRMSSAVRALDREGQISFGAGEDHLAEVEFDHANQGRSADFRPALPLRFRW